MPARRQVLWGIGGALGLVSGTLAWRFLESSDSEAIVMILHRRLDYLRLDEEGVRRFADDIAETKQVSARKLRIVPALGPLYGYLPDRHNSFLDALRHGEERIVSGFLLSSDFFINGADESRIVKYLGLYDPLHRPCGTPFSRPIGA